MFHAVVLFTHIFAACVTMAIIAGAAYAMVKNIDHWYKRLALGLAGIATLQIVSGVLLIVLSPELSALKVGVHLALYLGVCLLVEGALYLKARRVAWIS